jgi:hypothetical protein
MVVAIAESAFAGLSAKAKILEAIISNQNRMP